MSRRIHTLDRRELLRWVGRTSAGIAGWSLLGACDGQSEAQEPAIDGSTAACAATSRDVLGPYYRAGAPSRMTIAAATEPGERLRLEGMVVDEDCLPLAGVVLDVWQADKDGSYYEPNAGEPYRLRGKLATAADGTWQLETIRPGNYMLDASSWRPAHIHFTVSHPSFRTLTTQIYFEGDPFLPPNDGCTTCGSDDPARILPLTPGSAGMRGELRIALARA